MIRIEAYRANKILYDFIKSNGVIGNVIVPANVCQSVVDTLLLTGMTPLFVDISSDTLCADETLVKRVVQNASMFVFIHSYGVECNCPQWVFELRNLNPNIIIVDDCCLCLPRLNVEDNMADLVLFSLCKKKQVDMGIGGLGFMAEKWKYCDMPVSENSVLSNEKWHPDFDRIMEQKERVIMHKTHINQVYCSMLPSNIQFPDEFQNWRFNIRIQNKQKVLQEIFNNGLFASSHYPSHADRCLVAVDLYDNVINLFNDFYYSEEQATKTCDIIIKCLNQLKC